MMRNHRSVTDTLIRALQSIYRMNKSLRVRGIHIILILMGGSIVLWPSAVMSQADIQHTQNKPDQALRSEARIDPATHGMSLQVPLGMLPGRDF